MMIFVPLGREQAEECRDRGHLAGPLVAYAATPELMASHEYDASMIEDADFAAQTYAGIASLLSGEDYQRIVLAAEVSDRTVGAGVTHRPYGEVIIEQLTWPTVRAVFVDDHQADAALAQAKAAAGGADLVEVLELPAVIDLLEEHDLLWHLPSEAW